MNATKTPYTHCDRLTEVKERLWGNNMVSTMEAIDDNGTVAGLFQLAISLGNVVGRREKKIWDIIGDELGCQLATQSAGWESPWNINFVDMLRGPDRTVLDEILCNVVETASTRPGDRSLLQLVEFGFELGRFEHACKTCNLSDDLKEMLIVAPGFWKSYMPNGYLMPDHKTILPTAEIGEHSKVKREEVVCWYMERLINSIAISKAFWY